MQLQPRQEADAESQLFNATLTIAVVRNLDGQLIALRWLLRDTTERKQAEEQIRTLNAELEQRVTERTAELEAMSRVKDEFLAIVSHELRSPLNSILGWSQLLRSRQFDQVMTNRALETIERNAKLQTRLIEDLLDISRITQGKLRLNVHPVDLVPMLEVVLDAMSLASDAKGINLRFLMADFDLKEIEQAPETIKSIQSSQAKSNQNSKFCVLGDPDRLQQVF